MNLRFLLLAWGMLLLLSCEDRPADGVLGEKQMEDVLYDYHIAKAMADRASGDNTSAGAQPYLEAVYRKHGITAAEFDSSMRYYSRQADQLYDIYERLNKRFSNATSGVASSGYRPMTQGGDTLELWQGPSARLLTSSGCNRMEFKQECDTSYHAGDKIIWRLSSKWIYKEGMKSAAMVLAIRYEGDSVAAVSRGLYSTGRQELTIPVGEKKPLALYGLVYQQAPWGKTPKLLQLSEISLVKFRPHVDKQRETIPAASAARDSDSLARRLHFRDSIRGLDSANRHRPHFKEIGADEKPTAVSPSLPLKARMRQDRQPHP